MRAENRDEPRLSSRVSRVRSQEVFVLWGVTELGEIAASIQPSFLIAIAT